MANVTLHRNLEDRYGIGAEIFRFIEKLKHDPSSPGLHIEPVKNAQDPRVRTGRVTQKYRAVLFEVQGKEDKNFIFLDVLNHDDAYALAMSKQLRINPVSGVLEIADVEAADGVSAAEREAEIESRAKQRAAEIVAQQQAQQEQQRIGSGEAVQPQAQATCAEVLQQAGIGKQELETELGLSAATVAAVFSGVGVDEIADVLPPAPAWEADAITGLLAGMSIEDVQQDLGLKAEAGDSDEALLTALESPATQMEFVVDPSEEELQDIISTGSFDDWRIFLHPSQRHAVEAKHKGSARVVGGAGTGKTVVVVHRTKHLLEQNPQARILLTTYTRKLADSLKVQMNLLYPAFPEAATQGAPGLWINGIDQLIQRVLENSREDERKRAIEAAFGIAPTRMQTHTITNRDIETSWEDAATLAIDSLPTEKRHPVFLGQELTQVVLAQGITDEKSYLRANRAGRGTKLNRSERKAVWRVMATFMKKCVDESYYTFEMKAVIAAEIMAQREQPFFDHVLIDEAQDFHPGHWRFLRACTAVGENDIFLAEDSHQRIYGQRVVLSRFGIETRGRATNRLRLNYRTTAQNLAYASAILEGQEWVDSEEEMDNLVGYRSARRGPAPVLVHAQDPADEIEKVVPYLKAWMEDDTATIGLLTRSNWRCNQIATQLGELGLKVNTKQDATTAARSQLSALTMHNAKGLEFTHVALLDVGSAAIPQRFAMQGLAKAEQDDALLRERALLYVAASRARDQLLISVVGEPSELLPS